MSRLFVFSCALLVTAELVASAAKPAQVKVEGAPEQTTFIWNVPAFADRGYRLADPPDELNRRPFLKTPIDGCVCTVERPGELVCLTPRAGGPSPCSQDAALAGYGFTLMDRPGEFPLFGDRAENRVRAWRKDVKAGETFRFRKFVCILAREARPLPPEPVNVDVGRQMFLDDTLVDENTMTRTWMKPTIDPRSPVLKPETELERTANTRDPNWNAMSAPFSGGVWYDGRDGLYKCWYLAGWSRGIAYATSRDGIRWDRPDLDGKGNNLAIHTTWTCDSNAVLLDPDCTDGFRWKALFFDLGKSDVPGRRLIGTSVTVSRDGIHWEKSEMATECGDCSTAFYNPFIRKWVYSIRGGLIFDGKGYGRWRVYADGADFMKDAKNMQKKRWLLRGSAGGKSVNGQQLYNFDAVAYESVMIGLALVFNSPENHYWDMRGLPKIADLRFGFNSMPSEYDNWQFPAKGDYDFFLEGTRRYGDWNMGYLRSNAAICLVRGDELWFYFSGFAGQPDKKKEFGLVNEKSGTYANATMGIAKLRRDGFCALSEGTLRTRKLVFTKGDRLWINADVRQGALAVSVDGRPAKTVKGVDSTRFEVCPLTAGKPFTLTFAASGGAKLYSFWTSDAKGRSGGYLAGGSPESKTLRDVE